jgi:hypothetical protein
MLSRPEQPVTVARLAATGPAAAPNLARRLAHYLVTPAYQPVLNRQGVQLDRDALLAAVRCDDERAILRITEPLLRHYCVTDAADLSAHLEEARRCGVDGIVLFVPAYPHRPEQTERDEARLAELVSEVRSRPGRVAG